MFIVIAVITLLIIIALAIVVIVKINTLSQQNTQTTEHLKLMQEAQEQSQSQSTTTAERLKLIQETQTQGQTQFSEHMMRSFDILRGQLIDALNQGAKQTNEQLQLMGKQTDQRLQDISGQVEKRLTEGFEKTTATFQDVVKRLALIDEAQKKITELSSNVVSLQEILADKRSRGAFGEIQLSHLISNMLSASHYALQHTLSTGMRVDCILFLPSPTGNIAIDAKFPLESYQRMMNINAAQSERVIAERQFKQDIKKHINDISSKYIIPNETSDGAVMFIPAEAIFAEIHASYPELVEEAQQKRVWFTSPTTLMAILTTARAAIKDDATRKQIHIIQQHLTELGKDFGRFQERMDKLATHIRQANEDVIEVNTSAKKISNRFIKIEKADLSQLDTSEIKSLTSE